MDLSARAVYLAPITGITKNQALKQKRLHFPVTPAEFTRSGSGNWTTNNIIGVGEVAHPVGPTLSTFTMSSFFPPMYMERLCKGLRSPDQFRDPRASCAILEDIRDSNDIVWLVVGTQNAANGVAIIGDSASNVLMDAVRITDFSWTEAAGRLEQRMFDITFSQWTQIKDNSIFPFDIPTTYQPLASEDLRDVAVRFYRDIDQWKRIYAANKDKYAKIKPRVKEPLIPQVPIPNTKPVKKRPIVLRLPNPTGTA